MQELVYQHGIHDCFNHNIEILRDIGQVIGLHEMANGYNSMSWAITEGGRIAVMITNRKYNDEPKSVICEFQGDGCLTIQKCDSYGKPVDDKYRIFDTHSYVSSSPNEAFKKILKTVYDVTY